MILADSILQTVSIARCVSVAVTATNQTIFNSPLQGPLETKRSRRLLVPASLRLRALAGLE